MSVSVQYTALRSLTGVSSGTVVNYTIPVAYAGLLHSKRSIGTGRVAYSGLREFYRIRLEHLYEIRTIPLTPAQQPQMRMFLDSCEMQEQFLFSPTGTQPFAQAYLENVDYSEPLHPSRNDLITYQFTIVTI